MDSIQNLVSSEAWQKIDQLEQEIAKMETVTFPVRHLFTTGLYCREITMPAGSFLTSKIHMTQHPFVISKGKVVVWDAEHGSVELSAPYFGVTHPGTRRVLYVLEDCIWTTFHVTNETDVDKIGESIIFKHEEHLCLGQQ